MLIEIAITVISLVACSAAFWCGGYVRGHAAGVAETERRWSEAVAKGEAERARRFGRSLASGTGL